MNIEKLPEYWADSLSKYCNVTRNGKTSFEYQVQKGFGLSGDSTMNLFKVNGEVDPFVETII